MYLNGPTCFFGNLQGRPQLSTEQSKPHFAGRKVSEPKIWELFTNYLSIRNTSVAKVAKRKLEEAFYNYIERGTPEQKQKLFNDFLEDIDNKLDSELKPIRADGQIFQRLKHRSTSFAPQLDNRSSAVNAKNPKSPELTARTTSPRADSFQNTASNDLPHSDRSHSPFQASNYENSIREGSLAQDKPFDGIVARSLSRTSSVLMPLELPSLHPLPWEIASIEKPDTFLSLAQSEAFNQDNSIFDEFLYPLSEPGVEKSPDVTNLFVEPKNLLTKDQNNSAVPSGSWQPFPATSRDTNTLVPHDADYPQTEQVLRVEMEKLKQTISQMESKHVADKVNELEYLVGKRLKDNDKSRKTLKRLTEAFWPARGSDAQSPEAQRALYKLIDDSAKPKQRLELQEYLQAGRSGPPSLASSESSEDELRPKKRQRTLHPQSNQPSPEAPPILVNPKAQMSPQSNNRVLNNRVNSPVNPSGRFSAPVSIKASVEVPPETTHKDNHSDKLSDTQQWVMEGQESRRHTRIPSPFKAAFQSSVVGTSQSKAASASAGDPEAVQSAGNTQSLVPLNDASDSPTLKRKRTTSSIASSFSSLPAEFKSEFENELQTIEMHPSKQPCLNGKDTPKASKQALHAPSSNRKPKRRIVTSKTRHRQPNTAQSFPIAQSLQPEAGNETRITKTELKKLIINLSQKKSEERHEKDYLELLKQDRVQAFILQYCGIQKSMRCLVDEFNADPANEHQQLDFEEVRGALSYYNTHVGKLTGMTIGLDKKQTSSLYEEFIEHYKIKGCGRLLDNLIKEFEEVNAEKIAKLPTYSQSMIRKRVAIHNRSCKSSERIGVPQGQGKKPQKEACIAFATQEEQSRKTPQEILKNYKEKNSRSTVNLKKFHHWLTRDTHTHAWRAKTANELRKERAKKKQHFQDRSSRESSASLSQSSF